MFFRCLFFLVDVTLSIFTPACRQADSHCLAAMGIERASFHRGKAPLLPGVKTLRITSEKKSRNFLISCSNPTLDPRAVIT